ncbi:acylphosphatase [Candidatus Izimaplasma bacterium HR1]|uniref:acylphosphatase n=1 Tax=Candidatus Izimoplasma sp. HR1 TaxID=1541959 RepID=UPI00056FCA7D
MKKTMQLTLEGRVQGVGMRFTIDRAAKKFPITGYVRNLYNGFVQVVIQGEEEVLAAFIEHIKENTPGNISKFIISDLSNSIEYESFKVKLF